MSANSILITGTSTGIGYETAVLFAQQGWAVYATVRKQADKDKLDRLGYSNLRVLIADINDKSAVTALKEKLDAELTTGLHTLVNNAAVSMSCPFEFADDAHIQSQIDTNVTNTLILTRELLPLVIKAKGRIINISSASGVVSTPLFAIYSATKYAIEGFSDALRVELKRSAVKVIVVEPGVVNTPIHTKITNQSRDARSTNGDSGWGRYNRSMDAKEKLFSLFLKFSPTPDVAAKVIHKAVIAKFAKSRYKVGPDAKMMTFFAPVMPARLRDLFWSVMLKS